MSTAPTIAFGAVAFQTTEFFVREPSVGEDFTQPLPVALSVGWARDDRDAVARLRAEVRIAASPAATDRPDLDPDVDLALRIASITSVDLVGLDAPVADFVSTELDRDTKARIIDIGLGALRGALVTRSAGFTIAQQSLPAYDAYELLDQLGSVRSTGGK